MEEDFLRKKIFDLESNLNDVNKQLSLANEKNAKANLELEKINKETQRQNEAIIRNQEKLLFQQWFLSLSESQKVEYQNLNQLRDLAKTECDNIWTKKSEPLDQMKAERIE